MAKVQTPKSPLCVYYGEENYNLDLAIRLAKTWPEREVRVLDSSDGLTDEEIVDQLCMGSEEWAQRTVIVDDAQNVKEGKGKALRAYVDSVSATNLSTVLVAVVRDSKLSALWQYVANKGKATECAKLKTYGKTNEVIKYILDRATEIKLVLEEGVPDMLFKFTGGDLYKINNELRKLRLLASVNKDFKISKKHLATVISSAMKAEPWDVSNAAFAKNKVEAMNSLSLMYKTMGDEASVPITSALIRDLQKVIVARHMMDGGAPIEDIATVIDMHSYRCKEFFLPMVRKHDQRSLARHMSRLCRLDADVKGLSRSKRTLVELAVLSIAE